MEFYKSVFRLVLNDKDDMVYCHFDKMSDENHLPGHIKI